MKFQCDRCKTRYSIGEEKIRGKVLKIRCKNCSAVITVREGQSSTGAEGKEPAAAAKEPTAAKGGTSVGQDKSKAAKGGGKKKPARGKAAAAKSSGAKKPAAKKKAKADA